MLNSKQARIMDARYYYFLNYSNFKNYLECQFFGEKKSVLNQVAINIVNVAKKIRKNCAGRTRFEGNCIREYV